jgi:hypothetical protein
MTNAPAPMEHRGDRRRRRAGEWGRSAVLDDECGLADLVAFANGCARYRRAVRPSTTQGTPAYLQLAITTQEQIGTLGSPTVSAGARYASGNQTQRRQQPRNLSTGRGRELGRREGG